MGFKRVEKNRRSPDAISPKGTGQSVARHGSAGKHFKQIESRRDDTMGSSHADSLATALSFSDRSFLATTLSCLSSRAADLPAASQGWNERVDIEPLPTHERFCFVSGHDFSRAETQPSTMGFSPCSYLEHILFIRSEASGPLKRARA